MAGNITLQRCLSHFVAFCVVIAFFTLSAGAQEWGWGRDRGDDDERPRRPPPQFNSPPTQYFQPGRPQGQPGQQGGGSTNPRCKELEFQLASGFSQGGGGQDQIQRVEAEIRQVEAQYFRAKSDAERGDCYEDMFLFGRSLKRNSRCVDLDRQVQATQSRLASLRAQRGAASRSWSTNTRRDDLIAELARNRCGENYVREYDQQRNRSNSVFSFFSEEDPNDQSRNQFPYSSSTFRTMCVRLCDGFYFPISYATTESQFPGDAQKCQSQCAAPAELFIVRTDQDVEQMTSSVSGRPYSQMPNAFRNRKVYIKGCSCNASEFSREEIAKSEDALRQPPVTRADAGSRVTPEVQAAQRAQPQPAPVPPAGAQAPKPAPTVIAPITPPASPAR